MRSLPDFTLELSKQWKIPDEELEAFQAELKTCSFHELAYRAGSAAFQAGWWREWAEWNPGDRETYVAAMCVVEGCLDEIDRRGE